MKRSDLLKVLINIGNKYFHNDYEGTDIATEMLEAVENAGMLPEAIYGKISYLDVPPESMSDYWINMNDNIGPVSRYVRGDNSWRTVEKMNVWEPEDE